MSLVLLLVTVGLMQQGDAKAPPKLQNRTADTPPAEASPPEEDENLKPKDYAFNPLQAKKEVSIGDYYFKVKKNYKGAAARYEEATRWNSAMADAYRKLGEAEEKLAEPKLAREAYQKYLEMSPDAKDAGEVRKRVQKLPAS